MSSRSASRNSRRTSRSVASGSQGFRFRVMGASPGLAGGGAAFSIRPRPAAGSAFVGLRSGAHRRTTPEGAVGSARIGLDEHGAGLLAAQPAVGKAQALPAWGDSRSGVTPILAR